MEFGSSALWRRLHDVRQGPIRTFHLAWISFFTCLVAWLGLSPVLGAVRADLLLTNEQVAWIMIATLGSAIVTRPFAGWCCDRFGPRLTHSWILLLGSMPVLASAFVESYEGLLITRFAVGCVGASYVASVYHSSVMFGPNVVGQANGAVTGWGALGGAIAQLTIPLSLGILAGLSVLDALSWRVAMIGVGSMMLVLGLLYLKMTEDTPMGNYADLRKSGMMPAECDVKSAWSETVRDRRVWSLAAIYGACVGIEIAMLGFGPIYFMDRFELELAPACLIIGCFSLVNFFGRPLGGYLGDKFAEFWGLSGRSLSVCLCLVLEGVSLVIFSAAPGLFSAIAVLMMCSLFIQMTEGATFAVTPFVNRTALGATTGIVAGGGTVGALVAAIIFKEMVNWSEAFFLMGMLVLMSSWLVVAIQFTNDEENRERAAFAEASIDTLGSKIAQARLKLAQSLQAGRSSERGWRERLGLKSRHQALEDRVMHLEDVLEEGILARADKSLKMVRGKKVSDGPMPDRQRRGAGRTSTS